MALFYLSDNETYRGCTTRLGSALQGDLMRTLNRNKQKLYYSNQTNEKTPVYARNADGTIKTVDVDGVSTQVITGYTEKAYSLPQEFEGNIALSGGEVVNVDFGIDASAYDAVLVLNKNEINITETSLIWADSEPTYKDVEKTIVDPYSADYRVTRVSPSLNQSKYLLAKVVKK